MKKFIYKTTLLIFSFGYFSPVFSQQSYKNFKVSVYSRSYETLKMVDSKWIGPVWDEITGQVKVDKIYLETHRDLVMVDQKTLDAAKLFFKKRGVQTAGGITLTVDEGNHFETFCYSKPEHRKKVQEIIEYTAKNFDEIILDDFFFTNCKCDFCIKGKGDKSWTEYRLKLMDEAAREIILKPAKAVNPKVKVVIKYPNWYEHFQGLGFNLETEPALFDGLYTGTETRDPSGNQHLQQYLGYLIFRYFENLKPGGNGGGWVDGGGLTYLDRYAEQLWLTLFAKAPEITLFDIRQLQRPLKDADRAAWQGQGTTFDFDSMRKPFKGSEGKTIIPSSLARVAGYSFEQLDQFISKLGKPVGIKSYKPFHSTGEDFLQNYMGMIGVPMDIVSEFPVEENMIFLTQSASFDNKIVDKIKGQLTAGKSVMITSGLLKALQGKGIEDIVELRYTDRKANVRTFVTGGKRNEAKQEMLIPQIQYLTNDSWEEVSALDETNGWPILHSANYSKGMLYIVTIPENFTDLYNIPAEALGRIRQVLAGKLKVFMEGPEKVSMFFYDNNTLIVESFMDESVEVKLVADKQFKKLGDIISNESINGVIREPAMGWWGRPIGEQKIFFNLTVKPHSYRVFKIE
jgi:hypothetical protein